MTPPTPVAACGKVLRLYDEAASHSPAPPVKVTDEDVTNALELYEQRLKYTDGKRTAMRRVLEDFASRQGER